LPLELFNSISRKEKIIQQISLINIGLTTTLSMFWSLFFTGKETQKNMVKIRMPQTDIWGVIQRKHLRFHHAS
jgi:hypothetical protein